MKRIIEDEEEFRRLMTIYALNDCMAVTQLQKECQHNIANTTNYY